MLRILSCPLSRLCLLSEVNVQYYLSTRPNVYIVIRQGNPQLRVALCEVVALEQPPTWPLCTSGLAKQRRVPLNATVLTLHTASLEGLVQRALSALPNFLGRLHEAAR